MKSTFKNWRAKRRRRRLLQQVIPTEDVDENGEVIEDKRSSKYIDRPGFSLPLMTNNFRKFNARYDGLDPLFDHSS